MEQQEIQVIEKECRGYITLAGMLVTCQKEADDANDILKKIAAGLKVIEDKRKSFTAPLNQSLKEINATFKQMTEPIETAKKDLTSRLMAWRNAEQARIRAEQEAAQREEERRRKIQEAHKAKGHEVKETITPVEKPMPFAMNDTTKTRKQWTYEIINETQIPREYLQVNGPAITKAIRDGEREIPGVKIYEKEIAIFG
jgi:hypothetical protein